MDKMIYSLKIIRTIFLSILCINIGILTATAIVHSFLLWLPLIILDVLVTIVGLSCTINLVINLCKELEK